MTPAKLNRRDFLKTTSLTGLALAAPSLNVLGADDDLRLAVKVADGSSAQVPDAPGNLQRLPQPSRAKPTTTYWLNRRKPEGCMNTLDCRPSSL